MLVAFRIKDTTTALHSLPATITVLELAELMRTLHGAGAPVDIDPSEFAAAPINLEVNANALSMANFTRCFDHRAETIEVVEEAQFLGRTLRFEKSGPAQPLTMRVSEHIALARGLVMGPDLAAKVLYALGREDAQPGELTLEALKQLLQEPRIYDSFSAAQIAPIYESLSFLAFTDCGEQAPVMEWSQGTLRHPPGHASGCAARTAAQTLSARTPGPHGTRRTRAGAGRRLRQRNLHPVRT